MLSSSEVEFVTLSETVKEVRFIMMILDCMGIKYKKPIQVKVDNVGAIFMSENWSTTSRTKHMDTRLRFVNEHQDRGIIKVDFVSTKENAADVYTENTSGEILSKHTRNLLSKLQQDKESDLK